MKNKTRITRIAAITAGAALAFTALTGCSTGASNSDAKVTLTWWHNGTADPLKGFWQDVADEFEAAHPNVTIEVTAVQNEELEHTKIPNALRSGDAPDLYQQWGAGELAAQVAAGYVKDITAETKDEVAAIGGTASPWQVDGKQYGLPFSFGIEGFWYNKDQFAQAGITATPTTLDDLYTDIDKLKAAGLVPIAVGAGDKWPAAHYWYNFALKSCSPETLQNAQAKLDFSDGCFVKAGDLLQKFIASNPFQEGFLATPAQQGAGSSAGLVANGQAAMELMGHWEPGVMSGLTADGKVPPFLGWFNFPGIAGTDGDPTAALGGGDGFSCSVQAPPECVELLKYISSVDVQTRFGAIGAGLPVTKGSESSVSDVNLQQVLQGRSAASYVQIWLDTAYGPTVGGAMNDGITNMFAGQGTAKDIVKGMQDAAASQ